MFKVLGLCSLVFVFETRYSGTKSSMKVLLELQSVNTVIRETAVALFTCWFCPKNQKAACTLHECSGMAELVKEPDGQK